MANKSEKERKIIVRPFSRKKARKIDFPPGQRAEGGGWFLPEATILERFNQIYIKMKDIQDIDKRGQVLSTRHRFNQRHAYIGHISLFCSNSSLQHSECRVRILGLASKIGFFGTKLGFWSPHSLTQFCRTS